MSLTKEILKQHTTKFAALAFAYVFEIPVRPSIGNLHKQQNKKMDGDGCG